MSQLLHDINQHSKDNINYLQNNKYDLQNHMNYSGSKSKQTKRNKHASEKHINQSKMPRIKVINTIHSMCIDRIIIFKFINQI